VVVTSLVAPTSLTSLSDALGLEGQQAGESRRKRQHSRSGLKRGNAFAESPPKEEGSQPGQETALDSHSERHPGTDSGERRE
jgi:hypothetical protein